MAQCVVVGASGVLEASAVEPCTSLVALTPAEYASLVDVPWHLSPAEGMELSAAILVVWIGAWGIRRLWDALSLGGDVRE